MTDEQMRSVLLSYFKQEDGGWQLTTRMQGGVGTIAASLGLIPKSPQAGWTTPDTRFGLPVVPLQGGDWTQAVDVIWQMIAEGILRPGTADGHEGLPHLSPTRYGMKVIQDALSPYDPDSYFTRLSEKVPTPDPVIITYLREALHTFRTGCTLSSAVCLGAASERAFAVLLEEYADSLNAADKKAFVKKIEGKAIKNQFDDFMSEYNSKVKSNLSRELRSKLETYLNGLFQVIRLQRNEAGHPSGGIIDREQVNGTIVPFIAQLEAMYQLIDHLKVTKAP
jgi:hypothetical protein